MSIFQRSSPRRRGPKLSPGVVRSHRSNTEPAWVPAFAGMSGVNQ